MKALPESRKWVLYHLVDPRDGAVRYVGVTHDDPRKRLNVHVSNAKRNHESTHKAKWIRQVLAEGSRPKLVVVSEGYGNSWCIAEIDEIHRQRQTNPNLTNYQDGGLSANLGKIVPEETRKKISESRKLVRGYNIHPSLLEGRVNFWTGKKRPDFAKKVKEIWNKRRLPEWSKENLEKLYATGLTYAEIAKEMKCSTHLISKLLVEYKIPRNRQK